MRLTKDFYDKDALLLSKDLLGKILVHKVDGHILKGKIVETEAYIGALDKASHAYNNRRTERTAPLFGPAGISYVFFIYGMYNCFNIISGKENEGEGVLIRALEPVNDLEYMSLLRYKKPYSELKKAQIKNLTNGPGKLCIAMSINKTNNWDDLTSSEDFYLEYGEEISLTDIVDSKRIGIDYAEEARDFLWRFHIKDNPYVSK